MSRIRIRPVVGEGLSIPNEVLDIPGGDGEAKRLATEDSHVGDADDLATGVEEGATAVAGIDGRVGLDVGQAVEVSLGCALVRAQLPRGTVYLRQTCEKWNLIWRFGPVP